MAAPPGVIVAVSTPLTCLTIEIAGLKTATSSAAVSVTRVPTGSVPAAVAVFVMTWPARAVDEAATIWWSQVNFHASSRSSRLSPFRSPTLVPVAGTGSTVAHLSSVTFTLDNGVLPVLVTV